MLEANARSSQWNSLIFGPPHSQTPNWFRRDFKDITTSQWESMCKIWLESFIRYDAAHAMKCHVSCGFFLLTHHSIRFFFRATGHSFWAMLTVNGPKDVFLQPLVHFEGLVDIVIHLRGHSSQNRKVQNIKTFTLPVRELHALGPISPTQVNSERWFTWLLNSS